MLQQPDSINEENQTSFSISIWFADSRTQILKLSEHFQEKSQLKDRIMVNFNKKEI